ncbi:hypothetical protein H2200_009596 [Cladophialophora chaetospira]|uniref:F-box domain-containing protein n=1 Tax=Cladophialophora chaetospira TaxID=386627 RepID=A0AA38X321_9EURO|nr:hypothetical protein H2200_009596 [Cladophialophora chaetospira]
MASKEPQRKSISDLLDESIKSAEANKLKGALKAANAALKLAKEDNDPDLMSALKQRVCVHLQLQNTGTAFKGAKSMICLDPQDGGGYLLCGSIAKSTNNLSLAISYFEQGVKHVTATSPDHALVCQELADTQQERTTQLISKVKDPLTILPVEIVSLILPHLEYKQLVQMTRISRAWNEVLSNAHPLVSTLDFPGVYSGSRKIQISPKMLQAALNRLKAPKTLESFPLPYTSAKLLVQALQSDHFRTLESLFLSEELCRPMSIPLRSYNLKTLSIYPLVPISWVCDVIRDCPTLKHAAFTNVEKGSSSSLILRNRNIQELTLQIEGNGRTYHKYQVRTFGQIIVSRLEDLSMEESILPNLHLPFALEVLHLSYCYFPKVETATFGAVYPSLDNLRSLYLYVSGSFPLFIEQAAAKTSPGRLESLNLQHELRMEPNFMHLIEQKWFKGVESFTTYSPRMSDEYGLFLANCFPNLREVTIEGGHSLTEDFILDLVNASGTNLQNIDIAKRYGTDLDVVSWARERGITVNLRPW